MGQTGIKRKPTYKQMAFETAVRNPERYIGILTAIKDFQGRILDDYCLLEIVSSLYLNGIVKSEHIEINETATINDIKEKVIEVNSSRRADGGFPSGYASRFWTYMRTPSELGFVYSRYNETFKISVIGRLLIERKIDERKHFQFKP